MICQICKKNPATIHLTEIIKGEKRELHICEECAQETINNFGEISITNLIFDKILNIEPPSTKKCPYCEWTYERIKEEGKFGCPKDYEVFREEIEELLKKIHKYNYRSNQELLHIGKVPKRYNKEDITHQIFKLKKELQKAVEKENYEKAAELRDKIKELESKANGKIK